MASQLISKNLFNRVLIDPATRGADTLLIVSGYASAAMAFHHANELQDYDVNIKLIIGMTSKHGLSKTNHLGFMDLMSDQLSGRFECSYLKDGPAYHSKVYAWLKDDKPLIAYQGSPNYSQNAFFSPQQQEVCGECDATDAEKYYQDLVDDSIYCSHQDAEFVVDLYKDFSPKTPPHEMIDGKLKNAKNSTLEHRTVSFINRYNQISQRSGLNWGQREGREPNQAYIPLKSSIYNTNYFPPAKQHFTISTDDGKILICTTAQENEKAIETPHNNSLLGEYFRYRLGVPNGKPVLWEHFEKYGRFYVDFYKLDNENYFMDFSKLEPKTPA